MKFISLIVAVVALTHDAPGANESLLHPDDHIVFVGDSITGQGWNNGQGFIHQIEAALREKWPTGKLRAIGLGGSGAGVGAWQNFERRSREGQVFLDVKDVDVKTTLDHGADVLIIMLGMNDLLAPYVKEQAADLDAWAERYQALITALRERAKPLVIALATISLCSEDPASPKNRVRDQLNARLIKLAAAEHCIVLPVGETMLAQLQKGRARLPDFHITGDFVHPNSHGHASIAIGMLKGLGEHELATQLTQRADAAIAQQKATTSTTTPTPAPWLVATGLLNPQAWPANKFDPIKGRLPCDALIAQGRIAEAKATEPKLHWQEYHSTVNFTGGADPASIDLTAATTSLMIMALCTGTANFLFPFYMQEGLGWSPSVASSTYLALGATQLLASPITGQFVDRLGTGMLTVLGAAIVGASLLLASILGAGAEVWQVAGVMLLMGLGMVVFQTPNNSVIFKHAGAALGSASAIPGVYRFVGISLGGALGASFLTVLAGDDVVDGFSLGMRILAAIAIVGLIALQVLQRVGERQAASSRVLEPATRS